jgi:hypothetical protein
MTATQKRAQTMAARYLTPAQIESIARKQNRTTTTRPTTRYQRASTPTSVSDRQASMFGKNATIGQMSAINEYHVILGLRLFDSLAQFRAVVGDMRDASVLRASLKAQIYG